MDKHTYHVGEASMDERHWTISSTELLTQTEINDAFCNADFEIGDEPQFIQLNNDVAVTVVFDGVEFGDDAQVKLHDGELREEE